MALTVEDPPAAGASARSQLLAFAVVALVGGVLPLIEGAVATTVTVIAALGAGVTLARFRKPTGPAVGLLLGLVGAVVAFFSSMVAVEYLDLSQSSRATVGWLAFVAPIAAGAGADWRRPAGLRLATVCSAIPMLVVLFSTHRREAHAVTGLVWFLGVVATLWSVERDRAATAHRARSSVPAAAPAPATQTPDLLRVPVLALSLGLVGTVLAAALVSWATSPPPEPGGALSGRSGYGYRSGAGTSGGGASGSGLGAESSSNDGARTGGGGLDADSSGASSGRGGGASGEGGDPSLDRSSGDGDIGGLGGTGSGRGDAGSLSGDGGPGVGPGDGASSPGAVGAAPLDQASAPAPREDTDRRLLILLLVVLGAFVTIMALLLWPRPAARETLGPPWAEALRQRLEREGARRGRRRGPSETIAAYASALADSVLPDPRLHELGAQLSAAFFGRTTGAPTPPSWTSVLDEVCAAHPARRRRATAPGTPDQEGSDLRPPPQEAPR